MACPEMEKDIRVSRLASLDENRLADYRQRRFRQRPELAVTSMAEALEFIDEVGLCLFQPNRRILLPSLYGAATGSDRPAPRWGQHDSFYDRVWGWKDRLFSSGKVLYGKVLGEYRLFVSLRLLPYLYALSDLNYGGEEEDYLELYQDGRLSLDAKNVYGALLAQGPSSTTRLRRASGLAGGGSALRRFDRALTELQRGLMISAVGIADDNAWRYTFRYDAVVRKFAAQVEKSREIKAREAMRYLLLHYLWLVGEATLGQVSRLFTWEESRLWKVAEAAAQEGRLWCRGQGEQAALRVAQLPPFSL